MYRVLVINPGSTSTEVSVFEDETEVKNAKIVHSVDDLRGFGKVIEELPYRHRVVRSKLEEWGIKKGDLAAVVGRSGPRTGESGVFRVNQKMADAVTSVGVRIEHPAILGCVLNIEAVAILAAGEMKIDVDNVRLVIAHLEGGMSIVAFEGGRVVDTTNAFDEGPFTMERSGSLPTSQVAQLCFSGKYTIEQVMKMIRGEGGMVALLGVNSISDVQKRIDSGDKEAEFYLEAMCYQIAKDIGAMATVLKGRVDAVILTGKILDSARAVDWIKERVSFIAPIRTYAEQEAVVFARAGLSVLRGDEKAKEYN